MRFAKFAELSFQRACTAADAFAHPPDEDQNGWDYMVEFGNATRSDHSDMDPPGLKAFVQIKSTIGSTLTCRVKLSNALKAAQSPWPWFVILYVAAKRTDDPPAIYAAHIWRDLIARTLRSVRACESRGERELNRKTFVVKFDESDRKSERDLIGWMETCIKSVPPDYSQAKQLLNRTVGFEGGFGAGRLSFEVTNNNDDDVYNSFLGIGDGLSNCTASLTLSRFGIADSAPLFAATDAKILITPPPVGSCEIRLRGMNSPAPVCIPADVYMVGEPILFGNNRRFRFSGKAIELIWSANGYSKFETNFDPQSQETLRDIEHLITLLRWQQLGPIDLQIWAFGGRIITGTLNAEAARQSASKWDKYAEISEMLSSLANTANQTSFRTSLAEINSAGNDLYFMHQMIQAPSIMMEFIPITKVSSSTDKGLYYVWADVGNLTVYALIERPMRSLEEDGDKTRLVFGAPRRLESWIVQDATEKHRSMIVSDYKHHLTAMQAAGSSVFEIEDIRQLYEHGKDG